MGVKSTVSLTRSDAISKIKDLREMLFGNENEYSDFSDEDLEDYLEYLNDRYYQKTYGSQSGFDNYSIKEYRNGTQVLSRNYSY